MFRENPDKLPSDFVDHAWAMTMAHTVRGMLKESGVEYFGVRIYRAGEYPKKLRDAEAPIELLYYRGWWDLVETPSVGFHLSCLYLTTSVGCALISVESHHGTQERHSSAYAASPQTG